MRAWRDLPFVPTHSERLTEVARFCGQPLCFPTRQPAVQYVCFWVSEGLCTSEGG